MDKKEFFNNEPIISGKQYNEWEIIPEYWSRCEYCGLRFNTYQLYYFNIDATVRFCRVCLELITEKQNLRKGDNINNNKK